MLVAKGLFIDGIRIVNEKGLELAKLDLRFENEDEDYRSLR